MANKYHPKLSDKKALVLVRAAMEVRNIAIRVVASMRGQQNAPRYGPITSPPVLKFRPCTGSGLSLFFKGLPMEVVSEWGSLQIAESCSDEVTSQQCKEVIRRLAQQGVILDLDGDPNTEYLFSGDIQSVGGTSLPPVKHDHGAFRTFTAANEAYHAACREIYR